MQIAAPTRVSDNSHPHPTVSQGPGTMGPFGAAGLQLKTEAGSSPSRGASSASGLFSLLGGWEVPDSQAQRAPDLALVALQLLSGSRPNPCPTGLHPPPLPWGAPKGTTPTALPSRNCTKPVPTLESGGLPLERVLGQGQEADRTPFLRLGPGVTPSPC